MHSSMQMTNIFNSEIPKTSMFEIAFIDVRICSQSNCLYKNSELLEFLLNSSQTSKLLQQTCKKLSASKYTIRRMKNIVEQKEAILPKYTHFHNIGNYSMIL